MSCFLLSLLYAGRDSGEQRGNTENAAGGAAQQQALQSGNPDLGFCLDPEFFGSVSGIFWIRIRNFLDPYPEFFGSGSGIFWIRIRNFLDPDPEFFGSGFMYHFEFEFGSTPPN